MKFSEMPQGAPKSQTEEEMIKEGVQDSVLFNSSRSMNDFLDEEGKSHAPENIEYFRSMLGFKNFMSAEDIENSVRLLNKKIEEEWLQDSNPEIAFAHAGALTSVIKWVLDSKKISEVSPECVGDLKIILSEVLDKSMRLCEDYQNIISNIIDTGEDRRCMFGLIMQIKGIERLFQEFEFQLDKNTLAKYKSLPEKISDYEHINHDMNQDAEYEHHLIDRDMNKNWEISESIRRTHTEKEIAEWEASLQITN